MDLLRSLKSLFSGGGAVDVARRFELLREAISGTMSSFYLARDRNTGKEVGLKILDREKTEAIEARFQGTNKPREGEIAVQFEHPHIVKTFEHGVTTKGEQYLVMEYLDGPGLNSLIVAKSSELDGHRVALIRQAAQALAAVHRAGYIHRDICPRNFVVARDCRTLKLIDFGLSVPATPMFMQPGNRTGTPNYMAPEVVRRKQTSQKLDIFSFGVTVYEMCAFDLPWPKGQAGQGGQAAMAHGVEQPGDIRKKCPKLNPQLAAAIMACLQTKPTDRPQSMDHFLQMISGVQHEFKA
jgi:eukaryotic-like serine/threonine-protein kinase